MKVFVLKMEKCEDQPVKVLQQIRLWTIWQSEHFAQQRKQVNSFEPGVTVLCLSGREGGRW